MVRIMIKGGVWKNTEDEILKAAVMKYGKNQWSRVASLLNRKSAKQCKARWYEWLDPSIKKTEWTREEEEKLLHLAKIYPSQWRTISPIVGRTAAQCMEHYEHLLDVAQASAGDDGLAGAADDARKLRPGEIDPHPETKPARPDPIDMDEDEKEMLAEARARLANTRGKKAKRKAREKQLEEAKRLANLQKRRELKAAGVEKKAGQRKRKFLDYRTEIPFQRAVPVGFYDVGDERAASKQLSLEAAGRDFEVQRLDQMEGKRREKEEAEEMRKDRKKVKKMEEQNPAALMAKLSEANDPLAYRQRSALSLPAPQVSDAELEQVLKVGALAMVAADGGPDHGGGAPGSSATAGLVGDYAGRRALPTPMRTPRAEQGSDAVLQEAQNALRMLQTQTPLLGGQNPELAEGTGFGGITPRTAAPATPNAFALGTPLADGGGGGAAAAGATPLLGHGGPGGTPARGTPARGGGGQTPLRDELGMNSGDLAAGAEGGGGSGGGGMSAKRRKQQRSALASSLANLPEPQYAYEIEMPTLPEEEGGEGGGGGVGRAGGTALSVEDAADRDARHAAAEAAAEAAALARRSASVRRGLPRPAAAAGEALGQQLVAAGKEGGGGLEAAGALVRAEMARLLAHDTAKYPPAGRVSKKDGKKRRRGGGGAAPALEEFPDAALAAARALVAAELAADASAAALAAAAHAGEAGEAEASAAALAGLWSETADAMAYFPDRGGYGVLATASAKEKLSALAHAFETCRGHMAIHAEKCAKLERKLTVKTKGYEDKAAGLREGAAAAFARLDKRRIEEGCFGQLAAAEARALPQRLNELYDVAKGAAMRNTALQADYAQLLRDRDALAQKLAAAAPAAAAPAAPQEETTA